MFTYMKRKAHKNDERNGQFMHIMRRRRYIKEVPKMKGEDVNEGSRVGCRMWH